MSVKRERKERKDAGPTRSAVRLFFDRFALSLPFTFHRLPFASIRVDSRLEFSGEVVGGDVHSVS
jgi:hypothetical protein